MPSGHGPGASGTLARAGGATADEGGRTVGVERPGTARRGLAPVALVAVLLPGCALDVAVPPPDALAPATRQVLAPPPAPAGVAPDDAPLQEALDAVAAAFLAADPDALRPWLADPDGDFGRRWLARAEHLAALPLASYDLTLEPSLPDLATADVRGRLGARAQVRAVREALVLDGFDATGPAVEDLYLTLVPDGDRWRVAGDADAEPLGLLSVDHLWDQGPVATTASARLLAIHHPGQAGIDTILSEAEAALDDARARWPLDWPGRVAVVVPRDEAELATLLHVSFDLSSFIAFATATPEGELGDHRLTGPRVVLNTPRFLSRPSDVRRSILVHELVHVATRPSAGPVTPSWLEEGVAQSLGERRSTTGTGLLDRLVAAGFDGALPTDGQFTTGGRERIFLSYQLAWSFVDHLVRTRGADEVAAFYAELGRGSVARPGTEPWHVDRAAREVFGADLAALRAEWRDAVRPSR